MSNSELSSTVFVWTKFLRVLATTNCELCWINVIKGILSVVFSLGLRASCLLQKGHLLFSGQKSKMISKTIYSSLRYVHCTSFYEMKKYLQTSENDVNLFLFVPRPEAYPNKFTSSSVVKLVSVDPKVLSLCSQPRDLNGLRYCAVYSNSWTIIIINTEQYCN